MKKIVSIILLAVMLMSMTACTKNAEPQIEAADSTNQAGTEQTGTEQKEQEVKPEPEKLLVEVYDRGNMTDAYGTPIDNRWTQHIREKVLEELNIDVEFVAIPRSGDADKVTALLAAGTAPDIIYTYSSSFFYRNVEEEGLADLTDAMANYGQTISTNVGEEVLKYGKVDGKQYAIVSKRAAVDYLSSFIRKDWLDKLGYKTTERNGVQSLTVSELKEILHAFQEAGLSDYPCGVYNHTGVVPESTSPLYSAFADKSQITDKMVQTQPDFTWPGMSEGFRYLNTLYNEGLINPDFVLQKSDDLGELVASGQLGFWSFLTWGWMDPGKFIDTLYSTDPNAEVIAVDITSDSGMSSYHSQYDWNGAYIMVPAASEHVDAAVKYINWLADYENDFVLRYGIEGEHFDYNQAGLPVAKDITYNSETMISTSDLIMPYNGDPNPKTYDALFLTYPEKIQQLRRDAAEIGTTDCWGNTPYFGKLIETESEYSANTKENVSNLRVSTMTCKPEDFDKVFADAVAAYLRDGGQEIIDEKAAAYDTLN